MIVFLSGWMIVFLCVAGMRSGLEMYAQIAQKLVTKCMHVMQFEGCVEHLSFKLLRCITTLFYSQKQCLWLVAC